MGELANTKAQVPENCVGVKDMTSLEVVSTLGMLAGKLEGPFGVGLWEGEIKSHGTGALYPGPHLAVFNNKSLMAPFGPQGDTETEMAGALFAVAANYAAHVADKVKELQEAAVAVCHLVSGSPDMQNDHNVTAALRRLQIATGAVGEEKCRPSGK